MPIFCEEVSKVLSNIDYESELILVSAGSSDRTLDVIKELIKKYSGIEYISFSRNFGKESAMFAGFCNCVGDYVAVMDADMQDHQACYQLC